LALRLDSKSEFESLFRDHYAPLVGYALRMVNNRDHAEDIVQQIFVGLWEKRADTEIEGSPKSYLLRSVHNACLNHIKHLKVRSDHASHTKAGAVDSELRDHLEEEEFRMRVKQTVQQLPTQCRKIFLMSRVQGKKYQQIADELDLSVKTVENQMGKALKLMREGLQSEVKESLRAIRTIFWLAIGVKLMSIVMK